MLDYIFIEDTACARVCVHVYNILKNLETYLGI